MTDARNAQQPPHARDDVVRGRTFGFVDDEEAVDVSAHRWWFRGDSASSASVRRPTS